MSEQPRSNLPFTVEVEPFNTPLDFAELLDGGPDPVGDYCRRIAAEGGTGSTSQWTNQRLKESGAGFWADMARQGGLVLSGNDVAGMSVAALIGFVTVFSVAPVTVPVTGQAVTTALNGVLATGGGTNVAVSPTGQQVTVSEGSVTVNTVQAASVAVTGQAAVTAAGNVGSGTTATVNVTGQQVAASVGTVTVAAATSASVSVTGQAVTASLGTVFVSVPAGLAVNTVFSTVLWTGNATTGTSIVTPVDLSTKGGMLMIKNRDSGSASPVYDTVRTANNYWIVNSTAANATISDALNSFNTNGFSIGAATQTNLSTNKFVGWSFAKAAGFFDMIAYTGDGTSLKTIAHGLGCIPGMIWVKRRDSTGSCLVSLLPSNPGHQYNLLPDGNLPTVNDTTFGGVAPDASNFYLGNSATVNASGGTYMAYVFAHDSGINGVSYCGSYVGNGSTTGPVVTIGWRPQFVLVRRITGGTGNWSNFDLSRGIVTSGFDAFLSPNLGSSEDVAADRLELTSTGFQIKSSATAYNNSGDTYVYYAVRDQGLIQGLPWTAGANTTASNALGFERATTTTGSSPRVIRGPFQIVNGKTYTLSGKIYARTASACAFYVSTSSTLASGDVYSNSTSGTLDLSGLTFTATYTGLAYAGIVGTTTTTGDYCEVDDTVNFTMV